MTYVFKAYFSRGNNLVHLSDHLDIMDLMADATSSCRYRASSLMKSSVSLRKEKENKIQMNTCDITVNTSSPPSSKNCVHEYSYIMEARIFYFEMKTKKSPDASSTGM